MAASGNLLLEGWRSVIDFIKDHPPPFACALQLAISQRTLSAFDDEGLRGEHPFPAQLAELAGQAL